MSLRGLISDCTTQLLGEVSNFLSIFFQSKRREAIKKRGKQNFGESIARGGKGLFMGIVDGVTGVATKPIEGAKEDGVGGFFKGISH